MPYVAPTVQPGAHGMVAGTGYAPTSDQEALNVADDLYKYWEHKYRLIALIQRVRKDNTVAEKMEHLEDKERPLYVEYTGSDEGSAGTTVTIANYKRLQKYDALYNVRAKDYRYVDTTPSSASVSVVVGVCGKPSALWKTNDKVRIYSNSHPEGFSNLQGAIHTVKTKHTFYCQTMGHPTEVTDALAATPQLGDKDERALQWAKVMKLHEAQWEATLILGGAGADNYSETSAVWGHKFATGIMGFATTNRFLINGPLYWQDLQARLAGPMHWWPGSEGVFACSTHVANIISEFGADRTRYKPDDKMFGSHYDSIKVNGRKLAIIEVELLNEDPDLSQLAIAFDPANIAYSPHVGNFSRDTKLLLNVKNQDGNQTFKDAVVTTAGFEYWNKDSFAVFEGIEF